MTYQLYGGCCTATVQTTFQLLLGFRLRKVESPCFILISEQIFVMPTRCVVAGCSNTPGKGVSLHRFPKDKALCKIWITKVRLTRAKWNPSPTSVICSDHFTADDFEKSLHGDFGISKAPRLSTNAVPTRINKPAVSANQRRRSTAVAKREKKQVS